MHLVALGFQPLEEAPDAVPHPVIPLALALQHPVPLRTAELLPGHVDRDGTLPRETHQVTLAFQVGFGLPRFNGPVRQRFRGVRHHQVIINAQGATEPAAGFAGADRRIEGEMVWRGFLIIDIAIGAVQSEGITPGFGSDSRLVKHTDIDPAMAMAE